MKRLVAIVVACALATPANGKSFGEHGGYLVVASESSSPKDLGFCVMTEEFEGPGETRLAVLRNIENPDMILLSVENYNWTTKKGLLYKQTKYSFGTFYYERDAVGTTDAHYHGLVAAFPAVELLATFASSKSLDISRDKVIIDQLTLAGSQLAKNAFSRCWAYLLADHKAKQREWNRFNHIPKNPFASDNDLEQGDGGKRASPMGKLEALFSRDDYPQTALAKNEEGVANVLLTIGPDGRVVGCAVTASSGSAHLDSATCSLLRRRARFTPARDVKGLGVTDEYKTQIVWRLPPSASPDARLKAIDSLLEDADRLPVPPAPR